MVNEPALNQVVPVLLQILVIAVEEEPVEAVPVRVGPPILDRYTHIGEADPTFQTDLNVEEARLEVNVLPTEITTVQQFEGRAQTLARLQRITDCDQGSASGRYVVDVVVGDDQTVALPARNAHDRFIPFGKWDTTAAVKDVVEGAG